LIHEVISKVGADNEKENGCNEHSHYSRPLFFVGLNLLSEGGFIHTVAAWKLRHPEIP